MFAMTTNKLRNPAPGAPTYQPQPIQPQPVADPNQPQPIPPPEMMRTYPQAPGSLGALGGQQPPPMAGHMSAITSDGTNTWQSQWGQPPQQTPHATGYGMAPLIASQQRQSPGLPGIGMPRQSLGMLGGWWNPQPQMQPQAGPWNPSPGRFTGMVR
jgi:hypothetical protein